MTDQIENYDYEMTSGDHFLALMKKLIPNPETRHDKLSQMASMAKYLPKPKVDPAVDLTRTIQFQDKSNTLTFGSPVMLAAGANKYGENIPDFARLGFGGVSVGTVTRRSREGNPYRPRIRMLEDDRGIQNSMGLNNPGVEHICKIVDRDLIIAHKKKLAVGISISETPGLDDPTDKLEDIIQTFRKAYNAADYVEINVSCPNTGHQRIDSQMAYLEKMLQQVMSIRKSLPVRKAVYAKLSPDMGAKQLEGVLELVKDCGVNGLILFNTFPGNKAKYLDLLHGADSLKSVAGEGALGGLSGRPLYVNTYRAVSYIKEKYPEFSILASGGIDHGQKVWDLMNIGADAVQSYSVLAYRWLGVWKMLQELQVELLDKGQPNLDEYFDTL